MGSSVDYVIFVQSFVSIFEGNFIDRDRVNLINYKCISVNKNKLKNTYILDYLTVKFPQKVTGHY